MVIPRTIKVGPHTYTVVRKTAEEMPDSLGSCEFDDLQIWIRKRLRTSKAKEILLHEVLHACTHPTMNCSGDHSDEDFVAAVAPVLLEVMLENPKLVEYLTK